VTRSERIAALGYDPAAEPAEAVTACNPCGATRLVELARRDRYGYASVLVACARCGLAFLSPRPTAGAYAGFYERTYRPLVSAYHGRRIDAETVQDEQRGYAAQLAAYLDRVLSRPPAGVLDVGAPPASWPPPSHATGCSPRCSTPRQPSRRDGVGTAW
jgi:hypothetical protein